MNDTATRRTLRTILQLIASGALTALVTHLANGLSPETTALTLALWQAAVTFAQNAAENYGIIQPILGTKEPVGVGQHHG